MRENLYQDIVDLASDIELSVKVEGLDLLAKMAPLLTEEEIENDFTPNILEMMK